MIYPLFSGVSLSFTTFSGVGEAKWTGLDNYQTIFTDSVYLKILSNTLIYSAFVVVFQNGIGLAIASMLNGLPKVRSLFRTALLVPSMVSLVIAGYVWQYLYSPLGGGLNEALAALGLKSVQQIWLGDPSIALIAVAAVHVWMYIGYSAAIFLAGYAGISSELQDAARMDGATRWKRFRFIEFPLLAPALTVNITLATINSLKSFEFPYIMTGGGPDGATMTLGLKVIKLLFNEYKFGLAAALSVVLIVMVASIGLVQNAYLRRREDRI
ncbi:sugar ABC transporter permease [Alginatibacterium sediminis]|uniref:Sugar ABC transporter permease n=2 Tax=Alginatibacterium sediminis TaxID=2164068 RepID=A0A420EIF2_9ALTE|nr:sugar ABC transporter permease [Alginatibacterium sediminis]